MPGFPRYIPYSGAEHAGIEHAIAVGDINNDGNLEVIALGCECVRAWDNKGKLLFERLIPKLFPNKDWVINTSCPIIADVDGDNVSEIVFQNERIIYAIKNDGTDVVGFPIETEKLNLNGISIADINNDGYSEIVTTDQAGYVYAWKTNGKSTAIEWGRSRFDTGFTGEYISHYEDPKVLTASTEWGGGAFTNDIIVRSGTFKIPSGKTLQMRDGYRIYVLEGGTLEVDGGIIQNADVLVKSGGTLNIKNNGGIHLNRYGKLNAEKGAIVNALYGEVQTVR